MPGHMTVHVGTVGQCSVYLQRTRLVMLLTLRASTTFSKFRAPDSEMYRVSRLLRRGRVGSKVRTRNDKYSPWNWTLVSRLYKQNHFLNQSHAAQAKVDIFATRHGFHIIAFPDSTTLGSWHAISHTFPFILLHCTDTWHKSLAKLNKCEGPICYWTLLHTMTVTMKW